MRIWIIEPRDPLIARDGRPFGPNPGARATSIAFPFPSTTTGGVRTRAGLGEDGVFNANIDLIKSIGVRGPLMVELDDNGEIKKWLAPAPSDALLLDPQKETDTVPRHWLAPRTNLADGLSNLGDGLIPVGPDHYDSRKPLTEAPRFWFWEEFESWLLEPKNGPLSIKGLGRAGPILERRTHVGINPGTQAAIDGALFATAGLEFTGKDRQRLAMAVKVGGDDGDFKGRAISTGLGPLGGERRLMHWKMSSSKKDLPACPPELRKYIIKQKVCRLILLTPAYFKQGWQPTWLVEKQYGVTPRLAGVALGRAQVVSGWDFEKRGPKPTRRLVPAGSVFFLYLQGDDNAIGQWVDNFWVQCVSDDIQDRLDGFGLAALGVWPDVSESKER